MDIRNNTILITGGTSGIGLAPVDAFRSVGNRVVVAAHDAAALEKLKEKHPAVRDPESNGLNACTETGVP